MLPIHRAAQQRKSLVLSKVWAFGVPFQGMAEGRGVVRQTWVSAQPGKSTPIEKWSHQLDVRRPSCPSAESMLCSEQGRCWLFGVRLVRQAASMPHLTQRCRLWATVSLSVARTSFYLRVLEGDITAPIAQKSKMQDCPATYPKHHS